jgi:hypothetical protein
MIAGASISGTTFGDEGLSPNTTYDYRVQMLDASGPTQWSAVRSVTTLPPAPTGAPTLTCVLQRGFTAQLTWGLAPGATAYKVEVAPDASGAPGRWMQFLPAMDATGTSYGPLDGNARYWFRVRGATGPSNGPYSEPCSVLALPGVPDPVSFTGVGPHSVTVTWAPPAGGADSYKVARGTGGPNGFVYDIASGITSLSFTDTSVDANYWYAVRATNAVGDGSYSQSVPATTQVIMNTSSPARTGNVMWSESLKHLGVRGVEAFAEPGTPSATPIAANA